MKNDGNCQCPHCRLSRDVTEVATGDFMAQAEIAGSTGIAALKKVAMKIYADSNFDGSQISPATFTMMVAASLFHEATVAMAEESHRKADISAMMIGMRIYSMTFGIMAVMDESEIDPAQMEMFKRGGEQLH